VVRENGYVFPWVEGAHVVALSFVVGFGRWIGFTVR